MRAGTKKPWWYPPPTSGSTCAGMDTRGPDDIYWLSCIVSFCPAKPLSAVKWGIRLHSQRYQVGRHVGCWLMSDNTNAKWWRDPGLRMNVVHAMGCSLCVYYLGCMSTFSSLFATSTKCQTTPVCSMVSRLFRNGTRKSFRRQHAS